MARLFNDGLNQSLNVNSVPVAAVPLSMACWFNVNNLTKIHYLMLIGVEGTQNNRFSLICVGSVVGDPIFANTRTVTAGNALTTTGYSVNTWHHACAVFIASNNRAAYIDGGSKGTNAVDRTPAGMDLTTIGRRPDNVNFMSGSIAEAAIWNAALTDAEVAVLAAGYSPLFVRPQSLIFYMPLVRDNDEDIVGGLSLTAIGGPTIAPHMPIIYPSMKHLPLFSGFIPPIIVDQPGGVSISDASISDIMAIDVSISDVSLGDVSISDVSILDSDNA